MDKVQFAVCFSYFFAYMLQIIIAYLAYRMTILWYNFFENFFKTCPLRFVQTAFYP